MVSPSSMGPFSWRLPLALMHSGICSSQSRGLYLCFCIAPATGAGTGTVGTATKPDVLECGAQASDLANHKQLFTVNKLVISPRGSIYANIEIVLGLVRRRAEQIRKCFLQLEILIMSNALAVTCFTDGLKNRE